jgi:superkiller protein 3
MTLKTILLLFAVATVLGCENRLTFEELMKQGEQYSAEGKTEKAIEAYKKAVAQKPDDTRAHEKLGNAYYQGMEAIFRRSATNAKEWEQIKNEGNKLGDMAVAEYRKVLQKDKDNWKIRYMVAVDLFNKKKYKEAIQEFNQTIQSNPKCAVAYSVLASSYLGVGQYDLALKNIEWAHTLDADNEHYYFCLGKAYYFMKDETRGFEMERRLKTMKSKYYQDLLDYRFSHNREP